MGYLYYYSTHPFQSSGVVMEQGRKECVNLRMRRTTVSGHHLAVTQMNPQYLELPTQDLHKIKRITSVSTEEGRGPPQWPTSEELMAADGC